MVRTPHPWIFESTHEPRNMVAVLPSITGKPPLSWLGLRWYFKPNLWAVIFPYWILIAVVVAIASLSRLHGTKRFSLRTLLVATTLVAVGLSLIVWAAK